MLALGIDALAQGSQEIRLGPFTDAVLGVGRDVGTVEHAERRTQLDAAGIPALVASDNTRDPFYAYGDLDMLEVFREATRILHFDHSDRPWLRLLGPAPADAIGLPAHGRLAPGAAADFVVTRARTLNELVSRPQSDRVVVVGGKPIDATPPDYRELDPL